MEGGFAMTLTQNNIKSSGKSIIRKIPLDITFAEKKIGKGAKFVPPPKKKKP